MYAVSLTDADDHYPGVDAVLNKLEGGRDRLVEAVLGLTAGAT
jgi:hypothetical protein